MPKQRFGLGRGLDALIPGAADNTSAVSDEAMLDTSLEPSALFEVPVEAISPNPQQPRMPLGADEQLLELARSIEQYGLLQPLLVALDGADEQGAHYQLIAGERRWRAAQLAGLERVPVVLRDVTPLLMLEMALVENLQRTDLNPIEEAQGYAMLVDEYGLTQEQVAERIGKKRSTVANTLRLLQLPEKLRDALIQMPGVFTEGHARAVLQINGEAERISAFNLIVSQKMSVRQAEELARRYNEAGLRIAADRRGAGVRQQSPETHRLEEEFTRAVEMKVRLQRSTKGKGYLTLYFTNEDQLQRLYERLVQAERENLALMGNGNGSGNGHDAYSFDPRGADGVGSLLDDTFDISFEEADPDSEN